ncbi:hypothetical protein PanWU01x14_238600 [Parasponia andersonii]|uniref:TRF2/HOY1 PH-like domain-containing protein n=1 Tax=Parasponia andersonii TaxID=3476 RepID=A0A2P5BHE8_PARAD|nr:hypothetical protein PanWU01x14_238600 [Parasponia andersonii]
MDMDPSKSNNNGGKSSASETNSASEESRIITELANQRLLQTPIKSKKQTEIIKKLLRTPPLGLELDVNNWSFLEELNRRLYCQRTTKQPLTNRTNHNATVVNSTSPTATQIDKKATHLYASFIEIGSWKRAAQHSEDLVAKCYFAKKRLVWEILEMGLKSKIEIHWNHIVGMRVALEENWPGIFEIELSQPPLFFKEICPRPMKHTLWDSAPDFTYGQAKLCRIHYLQFPPGAFDIHFEKLLLFEPRFLHLCKSPFPTEQSLYFPSNFHNMASTNSRTNSFGYNYTKPNINSVQLRQQQQQHCPAYSRSIPRNTMPHLPHGQLVQQYNQVHQANGEPSIFHKDSTHAVTEASQKDYNPATSLACNEGRAYNPLSEFPRGKIRKNRIGPLTGKEEAMTVIAAPGNYYSNNYGQAEATGWENGNDDTQQSLYVPSNFHNMANTSSRPFGYNYTNPNINSVHQQQQQYYPTTLPHFSDRSYLAQQHNQVYQTTGEPSMLYKDCTPVVTAAASQNGHYNPISCLTNENQSQDATNSSNNRVAPLAGNEEAMKVVAVPGCSYNNGQVETTGCESISDANFDPMSLIIYPEENMAAGDGLENSGTFAC